TLLAGLTPAPVVRVVELPGLPEGGDIVEWIGAHENADHDAMRAEIERLAEAVEPEAAPTTGDAERFRPFPVAALPEPIRGCVAAGRGARGARPVVPGPPPLAGAGGAGGQPRGGGAEGGRAPPADPLGCHRRRERDGEDPGLPAGHAARPAAPAEGPGPPHRGG